MRQLFFIAPKGYPQVKASVVQSTHGWHAPGDDPKTQTVIGVVQVVDRRLTMEEVIDKLEEAGCMCLPNHLYGETIAPEHAAALAKHGVLPTHNTREAMAKVSEKSGFPPHKTSKF